MNRILYTILHFYFTGIKKYRSWIDKNRFTKVKSYYSKIINILGGEDKLSEEVEQIIFFLAIEHYSLSPNSFIKYLQSIENYKRSNNE